MVGSFPTRPRRCRGLTHRNHNKYPGKIPRGPQRKVRQKGHFLALSREMLGNLPVRTSKMEEEVRPAYTAEGTHPQPFRRAQRWSSQHQVSPGEQAIQSSKVTANGAEPHPCMARTASWTLSVRGPGRRGAVVRGGRRRAPACLAPTPPTGPGKPTLSSSLEFPLPGVRVNGLLTEGKPKSQRSLWPGFIHTRSCSQKQVGGNLKGVQSPQLRHPHTQVPPILYLNPSKCGLLTNQ